MSNKKVTVLKHLNLCCLNGWLVKQLQMELIFIDINIQVKIFLKRLNFFRFNN